jgi:Flp pilus assembly protein TadD
MIGFCLLLLLPLQSANPDGANIHAQNGLRLQSSGQLSEAVAEYRESLKLAPKQPGVLTNLGAALAQSGDLPGAVATYKKALVLDPNSESAALNLAIAYYKLSLWLDASEYLLKYHRAHPQDLRSGLLLGDCYLQLGEARQAVATVAPLERAHS